MIIIPTQNEHVHAVLQLYQYASAFLKQQGIDQWQHHYPNATSLYEDMLKQGSYVLIDNDQVVATMACLFEVDPFYNLIDHGTWEVEPPYGVVHRICVHRDFAHRGYATHCLTYAQKLCHERNVNGCRIDTHPDNMIMQQLLRKLGFTYRGHVYVANNALRLAFDWRKNEYI